MCKARSVTVVTVTYGARWKYLQQVLGALACLPEVKHIVVVDNASSDDLANKLAGQQGITLLSMGANKGSAKGYKSGIDCALNDVDGSEFIYLIDDDNLPNATTLSALLQEYESDGGDFRNAYSSLRRDRPELVHAMQSGMPIRHIQDSFSGFHILHFLRRKCRENTGQAPDASTNVTHPKVEMDYAPYGGLLMHVELAKLIGPPEEAYFLYADDHEYSSRIPAHGGKIFLVGRSEVIDIETSWHLAPQLKTHPLFSNTNSDFRVYYSVRNRVALEKKIIVHHSAVYFINLTIYLTFRALHALAKERDIGTILHRAGLILGAVADGLRHRLGESFRMNESAR